MKVQCGNSHTFCKFQIHHTGRRAYLAQKKGLNCRQIMVSHYISKSFQSICLKFHIMVRCGQLHTFCKFQINRFSRRAYLAQNKCLNRRKLNFYHYNSKSFQSIYLKFHIKVSCGDSYTFCKKQINRFGRRAYLAQIMVKINIEPTFLALSLKGLNRFV